MDSIIKKQGCKRGLICITVVFSLAIILLHIFKYENNSQAHNEFNGSEIYNFDLGEQNRLFEGEVEHSEMGDYQISFMGYVEEFQCIKVGGV